MQYDPRVYGYVNGKPTYSRDEFIFECRHFGPIETDEELLAYAEKVTSKWYYAGWHQSFVGFYLSDYALAEPYRSLTLKEFNRLKELQGEGCLPWFQHYSWLASEESHADGQNDSPAFGE